MIKTITIHRESAKSVDAKIIRIEIDTDDDASKISLFETLELLTEAMKTVLEYNGRKKSTNN